MHFKKRIGMSYTPPENLYIAEGWSFCIEDVFSQARSNASSLMIGKWQKCVFTPPVKQAISYVYYDRSAIAGEKRAPTFDIKEGCDDGGIFF